MPPDPVYDGLEQRIASWSASRSDIRAVLVVGSRAREDHAADEWSDLDLIIFVDNADLYQLPGEWYADLQAAVVLPVWFAVFDRTGAGDPEWDFVMEGGVKVDLVFTPNRSSRGCEANLLEMVDAFPYRYVIDYGMRVLVEKTPGPPVPLGLPVVQTLPDQARFNALIYSFLLDNLRTVKFSRRGEVWRAAQVINTSLQTKILTLLVWHTAAISLPEGVPYYRGRFLEEWASPGMLALLKDTFTGYSSGEIDRAVSGALRFLSAVTPEITRSAGLTYPKGAVEQVRGWAGLGLPGED